LHAPHFREDRERQEEETKIQKASEKEVAIGTHRGGGTQKEVTSLSWIGNLRSLHKKSTVKEGEDWQIKL